MLLLVTKQEFTHVEFIRHGFNVDGFSICVSAEVNVMATATLSTYGTNVQTWTTNASCLLNKSALINKVRAFADKCMNTMIKDNTNAAHDSAMIWQPTS